MTPSQSEGLECLRAALGAARYIKVYDVSTYRLDGYERLKGVVFKMILLPHSLPYHQAVPAA